MTSRYDLSPAAYDTAFQAFEEAVAKAPGQTAFANICRCTQGNISQLLQKRSLLPERFVLKAEAGTGIPRHRFRPDIYPTESSSNSFSDETGNDVVDANASTVACEQEAVSHRRRAA